MGGHYVEANILVKYRQPEYLDKGMGISWAIAVHPLYIWCSDLELFK